MSRRYRLPNEKLPRLRTRTPRALPCPYQQTDPIDGLSGLTRPRSTTTKEDAKFFSLDWRTQIPITRSAPPTTGLEHTAYRVPRHSSVLVGNLLTSIGWRHLLQQETIYRPPEATRLLVPRPQPIQSSGQSTPDSRASPPRAAFEIDAADGLQKDHKEVCEHNDQQ